MKEVIVGFLFVNTLLVETHSKCPSVILLHRGFRVMPCLNYVSGTRGQGFLGR